jgi:hypothetical protein
MPIRQVLLLDIFRADLVETSVFKPMLPSAMVLALSAPLFEGTKKLSSEGEFGEMARHFGKKWRSGRDSNPRPPA